MLLKETSSALDRYFRGFAFTATIVLLATPLALSAQSVLTGSVADTSGAPIFGATVTIAGSTAAISTDQRGRFKISNLPLGQTSVRVRRLGFVPFEVAVELAKSTGAEVHVRMVPIAAPLAAVVVRPGRMSYKGRLAGYYSRLEKKSSGVFISREDIDRLQPSLMSQLLQSVPGVRSVRGRGGISGIRMRNRMCWPLVWLDGMPLPAGEVDLDAFVPGSVQGIEIYLGSTTAPMSYMLDQNLSSCGTILIWSRGPDTDPVHADLAPNANLEELIARFGVHTAQNVDRRARLDSTRLLDLKFPPSLYASGTRGLVVAEFVVDSAGKVEDSTVGIISSTAGLFTDAVRTALATAVFVPALKNGHPVRQMLQQPFEFDTGAARSVRLGHPPVPSPAY